MSFTICMTVLGALLMLLALTSSFLRWLPVTTSAVCLAFGFVIGPMGLEMLRLDVQEAKHWLERLTEVAVLFSLFNTGIKLRQPLRSKAWHSAYWLAGPVMLATIAGNDCWHFSGCALPVRSVMGHLAVAGCNAFAHRSGVGGPGAGDQCPGSGSSALRAFR